MPTRRWFLKSAAAVSALGALGTSSIEPESLSDSDGAGRAAADPGGTPDENPSPDDDPAEAYQPQIRNVNEYGAAGNGLADDTFAIQRAFDAARAGDTIYFPPGEYTVGTEPPDDRTLLRVPTDVPDLTIAGDPGYENTRLVVAIDSYRAGSNFAVLRMEPRDVIEGLTIRNLTMDGNRPTQGPSSKAIYLDPDGSPGGHTVVVEDCWVENFNGPALLFRQGGVVLNRVTSIDNKQNFGVSERDDSTADTDEYGIVITDSVSKNADWVGVDHNQGGKVKIDGLYSANNGNSGLKTTKDNRRTRVENATFQNENSFAALRTNINSTVDLPDPPLELSLDTVAIREAIGGGIYLSGEDSSIQNSALVDGPIEIRDCGGNRKGSQGALTVHSAAGGTIEELRVVGTEDGPAVWFSGNHDLTIETLYHDGNDDGPFTEDEPEGDLTIESSINEDPGRLATPTEADVGAWSG